ncbi:MAG: hypothetical protein NXY57DRAFT_177780 [Lentinula lateritia]|nr:MAG: hypothetical protein NXY57DRAFT_177780 [Lentinula lateritia]
MLFCAICIYIGDRRKLSIIRQHNGTHYSIVSLLDPLLFFPHLQRAGLFVSSLATLSICFKSNIMKFTSISLVMPILVRILAMPCYATPIARLLELQDRGLPYHESLPSSYPILQLPKGSRCFFALNYNKKHDESKRLNFKGSQLKPNGEKFVCGALSKDIVQGKKDRLVRALIVVYSKEPRDPTPNTVSFHKTQMEMDHTLLTNEQMGFTGLCYTQIETQKPGDLEIPWQDWDITGWPTDVDGTKIPVKDIEEHHKAEAACYSDIIDLYL